MLRNSFFLNLRTLREFLTSLSKLLHVESRFSLSAFLYILEREADSCALLPVRCLMAARSGKAAERVALGALPAAWIPSLVAALHPGQRWSLPASGLMACSATGFSGCCTPSLSRSEGLRYRDRSCKISAVYIINMLIDT